MRKSVALSLGEQRLKSIDQIKRRLAAIEDMQKRLAAYLPVPENSVSAPRTLQRPRDGSRHGLNGRSPAP
ncbi:hypothetical protein ACWAT4_21180 [Bradyrhizobium manausense]